MTPRECKNCGALFSPQSPRQELCSPECKQGWEYRRQIVRRLKRDSAVQTDDGGFWETVRRDHLKRCVCANCFEMWWSSSPALFCSDGCRVLYGDPFPER